VKRILGSAVLPAMILLSVASVVHARKAIRANPPAPEPAAAADTIVPYHVLEKRAVEAAQRSSVHTIDTTLVDERFDAWFRKAVGPEAKVSYELNDCGESTGSPADSTRNMPSCVEASADWGDGRTAAVSLIVGSEKSGIAAPAGVFYAFADWGGETKSFHSLAEFSRFVRLTPPWPPSR
jgi:hypothetical protein